MKLFSCRSRSWSANVVGLLALILVAAPSIVMAQVNECQTNNGGCGGGSAFLATCTDTPGGFYCTCNLGFTGNGFSCSGDDLIMYLDATVSGSFIGSAWRDIPSNNSLAIPCQNVAYNDTVRSLYFNGASSMCQLNHTLGAASMWQPASVTMEAWVYAQACPPDQNILTRENSYEIGIHTPAGGSCNADAATNPWIWTYPPSPNLMNTWVHIVATHQNQTGGRKVIYVNGNETGSSASGGPVAPYAPGQACITVGSRYCGTQPGVGWFKGYISSVRLWGKALTASEVLRNYNMGIFGNGTKFNTSGLCAAPSPAANGAVTPNVASPVGTVANFSCLAGYQLGTTCTQPQQYVVSATRLWALNITLVSGVTSVTVTYVNGTWSACPPPLCYDAQSQFPDAGGNVNRICYESYCVFPGELQMMLIGRFDTPNSTVAIGLNRTVSVPINATTLQLTANDGVAAFSDNAGAVAVLVTQSPNPCQATCDSNLDWSRSAPACTATPNYCTDRVAPSNGAASQTGNITIGTVVSFTCNAGFVLSNASLATSTCLAGGATAGSGIWSSPVPACILASCDPSLVFWLTGANVSDASPSKIRMDTVGTVQCGVTTSGVNNTCWFGSNDANYLKMNTSYILSKFPLGSSARTLCGWGLSSPVAPSISRWMMSYGTNSTNHAFSIGYGSGGYARVGGLGNDVGGSTGPKQFTTADTWYHVCGALNGSNVWLYFNGTLLDTGSKPAWSILSSDIIGLIGTGMAGGFWPGALYDIRLYNRTLSAPEVDALYNNGGNSRPLACLP
eukprot:TRINITY_DN42_c0_g1_i3.p1 TRINITY_DN42_c0_g1~~TRINITY_DN42_c0_g1_i3.p1  ORF type:complete len:790 (+),score=123.49 TRINITY_DN42_c0_g1_i3:101-2470(+)